MKTLDGVEIKDCVGCGLCCVKTKCVAGARLYKSATICPALKWSGSRHTCDLMELPGALGETYRAELYAGEGCCMGLFNDWRDDLRDRTQSVESISSNRALENPIPSLMQTFIKSLSCDPFFNGDSFYLGLFRFKAALERQERNEAEVSLIITKVIELAQESRPKMGRDFMGDIPKTKYQGGSI